MKKENIFYILLTILISLGLNSCADKSVSQTGANTILLQADVSKYFYEELKGIFDVTTVMTVNYAPFQYDPFDPSVNPVSARVVNGKVTWIIQTEKPVKIYPPFGLVIVANPGDSIYITYIADQPIYSGKANIRLALLDTLMLLNNKLAKPRKKYSYNVQTLEDYLEWNNLLDQELLLKLPAIQEYKSKIPAIELNFYKSQVLAKIEHDRLYAFYSLQSLVKRGTINLCSANLTKIWDSTQNKPSRQWLQSLPDFNGSINDYFTFTSMETRRHFDFNFNNDSLKNQQIYTCLLYNTIKQKYTGLMRERLMAHVLDESTITEIGLKNPITQYLLKDYYSLPGYPKYKQYVKELEEKKKEKDKKKDKSS